MERSSKTDPLVGAPQKHPFNLGEQLRPHFHILKALLIRELKNRFGRFKLGYAWAILEPLGYVGAFSVIRVAFGEDDLAGLPFPVFFTLGVIPFLFFTGSLTQSLTAVRANSGLFNYRQVKPFHAVLARQILEAVMYLVSGGLILALFFIFGFSFEINNLVKTLGVLILFNFFCLGLGLLMVVWGPLFRESEKILPILIRPLFLLSGIFLPTIHIPEEYLPYVMWNPVLHAIELFRFSLVSNYQTPIQSIHYFAAVTAVIFIVGIAVYWKKERKLLTSGTIRVR